MIDKGEKGTVSYDFIVAIVMFITIYATLMLTVTYPLTDTRVRRDQFEGETFLLTDLVTKNPGYPANWTQMDQVELFGLALHKEGNNPHILDMGKLVELNNTDCITIKEKVPLDSYLYISMDVQGRVYECNVEGQVAPERHEKTSFYVWNGTEYLMGQGRIHVW